MKNVPNVLPQSLTDLLDLKPTTLMSYLSDEQTMLDYVGGVLSEAKVSGLMQCETRSHLVEAWYSLEQYIGLKEDKLSSTTVDFIRSEGNLETKHLYWFSKPKMC